MAKKEVVPTEQKTYDMTLPDFMVADVGAGTESLKQYVRPPRIKVMQKACQTPALQERFNPGDLIAMPLMQLFRASNKNEHGKPMNDGQPFNFIPLFHFTEYVKWNPLEVKGSEDAIVERSYDPNSELAKKCRTKSLWHEPHPSAKNAKGEPAMRRNVEHLNFIILVEGVEGYEGMQMLLQFCKGDMRSGTNFAGLIDMRGRGSKAPPIYGMRFTARAKHRPDNPAGDFWGIDVSNPSDADPVSTRDPAVYALLKEQHQALEDAFKKGLVDTQLEDPDAEAAGTYADNAAAKY